MYCNNINSIECVIILLISWDVVAAGNREEGRGSGDEDQDGYVLVLLARCRFNSKLRNQD